MIVKKNEEFYTNAQVVGNNILLRGYDKDGHYFKNKIPYEPTLYVPVDGRVIGGMKTLEGFNVQPKTFSSIKQAREFVKLYDDVSNFPIFGMTTWQYPFLNETYRGVDYNFEKIKIFNIDIETECADGFPYPEQAKEKVNAITIGYNGKFYSWGCEDYDPKKAKDPIVRANNIYVKCKDERQLLHKFLMFWSDVEPDIITGWYIEFFDIPYLVNRIEKILGEDKSKLMSPWRMVREKKVKTGFGQEKQAYDLFGVSILDYQAAYKKFTFTTPENFKLDTIAKLELKEKKLDYSEEGTLHTLYLKNFQKFMEYNVQDVNLVWRLEDKLRLLEMIVALAYDAGVNYNDTFTQVRMWDVLIHNELIGKDIVIPQKKRNWKDSFMGAYVKEPVPGMYNWVVSFDLASLYPHLIMQYNIGPETLIDGMVSPETLEDMIAGNTRNTTEYSMAANGHFFTRDKQGFLAIMMERMYDERKRFKGMMLEEEGNMELIKEEMMKREMEIA